MSRFKSCWAMFFLGLVVYITSVLFWSLLGADSKPRGFAVSFSCHPLWARGTLVIEGRRQIELTCARIEFKVDYDRTILLLVKEGCDLLYYDLLQAVVSGEAYISVGREEFEELCN